MNFFFYKNTTCRLVPFDVAANATGIKSLTAYSEYELSKAVAFNGPVSVAIDASLASFQQYQSGVYYDSLCGFNGLNHAVTVVGYDRDPATGLQYYIVKNSWSDSWGENGYIRMARNRNNNCGIASAASFPIV